MTMPVCLIENLIFRWGVNQPVCLNIESFSLQAGERVFLYGPSGSGKSTFLALLGGILLPEQGSVKLLDTCISNLSATARDRFRVDHMGFIFQQFNLITYLSVIDNVLLPCFFSAKRRQHLTGAGSANYDSSVSTTCMQDEAKYLLSQLDVGADLWHRPVMTLSVGQQQRVAAARALIGKPDIIIADEPTSALDEDRQSRFLELLLQVSGSMGAAVLLVSHDRRLASHFNREVALLDCNRAVNHSGAC
jgi:putative ABC transport system ATP-binding protein